MTVPYIGRCPVYELKPRVSYAPDQRLPTTLYGIRVPAGLSAADVPLPTWVSPQTMVSLLHERSGGSGGRLGVVHGLTTADFTIRFADFERQWRQVRAGSAPAWAFQGGDVFLDVVLAVNVQEGDRPQEGDDIGRQIFAIIMEHELLHVIDEIDIVTSWMPPRAYDDEMVKKYLTNAEPVDPGMFLNWFRGPGFTDWIKNGLWAPEHNARGAVRDAPAQYAQLQRRIDDLRSQYTRQH